MVREVRSIFNLRVPGGERGERRRGREERPERVAAVYIFKAASTAAENIGHRNRTEVRVLLPQPKTSSDGTREGFTFSLFAKSVREGFWK